MIVEAFRPEHVRWMRLQPQQRSERQHATREYLEFVAAAGPAVTLRDDDGTPIAAGGVMDYVDGSYLWAFLSDEARQHMVAIVRAARRLVQIARQPIYATVDLGFEPGCRLLRMLGFVHVADGLGISASDRHQHVFLMEASHVRR